MGLAGGATRIFAANREGERFAIRRGCHRGNTAIINRFLEGAGNAASFQKGAAPFRDGWVAARVASSMSIMGILASSNSSSSAEAGRGAALTVESDGVGRQEGAVGGGSAAQLAPGLSVLDDALQGWD